MGEEKEDYLKIKHFTNVQKMEIKPFRGASKWYPKSIQRVLVGLA